MRILLLIFTINSFAVHSQTVGGAGVFNFLNLPQNPQIAALGGINVSKPGDDAGMIISNPALLRKEMHSHLSVVFSSLYSAIRQYGLSGALYNEKLETSFGVSVGYINYGSIPFTDPSGNELGAFQPVDYVIGFTASRQYLKNWFYGATIKFIHSGYGLYRSSGIAMDAGMNYSDTANLVQAGLTLKNMGIQISRYNGSDAEDLPFDLQIGISKRLKNAPIGFSLTAHNLHRFNILYNDTSFNQENDLQDLSGSKFTADKLFSHIVLATQVTLGERIELTAGYNHLRRKELNIGKSGNGLNGFSVGVGVLFKKFQFRYARSHYQNNTAHNQVGLNIAWNKVSGL